MNNSKLNWLRAGVLGANDGIISVSVILVSVIGVLDLSQVILVGISATVAGAFSMAIGEYVSVSAQRDAEKAHNSTELTNPFHAAYSSFLAFVSGAVVPLITAFLTESQAWVIASVFLALLLTTIVSTKVGKNSWKRPLIRNFLGGGLALTMGVLVNALFGV